MSEGAASLILVGDASTELDKRLESVRKAADLLGSRLPRVRDPAAAYSLAYGMDALLRNLSKGFGALEVAIGEGLDALNVGRRAMDLGYSNIGDYAREELGINASTAVKMARLARKLRDRPLVREAVRRGEITARKAEIIAPVAVGADQARWIFLAKGDTVRSLNARVKAPPDPRDETWLHFSAEVPPEKRPVLEEGLRLAGIAIGATSSRMQRLNAWAQEYLGSNPAPEDDRADDVFFAEEDALEDLKRFLEEENRQWAHLADVRPLEAEQFSGEIDPWRIDAELKGLVAKRAHWDEVFGPVALLFQTGRAWHTLDYASFGHYCEEALEMSERTVGQRVAFERSLRRMPLLRQALREGRITYEKARLIAQHRPDELQPWIEKAGTTPCVALRREMQDKDEAQMCARGTFGAWVTVSVAEVVKGAFRAARAVAKRWLSAGECLLRLAQHFIETWKEILKEVNTLQSRIRKRDRHFCQVRGCSRAAVHAHHIIPRSRGGTDDPSNLVSLCAAHHLFGIHGGRIRVTGRAPDELLWEFGLRRSYVLSGPQATCGEAPS